MWASPARRTNCTWCGPTYRNTYGSSGISQPSRFLQDVPDELIRSEGARSVPTSREHWRRETYELQTRWTPQQDLSDRRPAAAILTPKYRANMRVNHPDWGPGMILESRIDNGEEVLDVHFESVGFKRLLAELAKLEILS